MPLLRFYESLLYPAQLARELAFRKQIIPASRRAKLFLSAKKTRTFEIFTQPIHEPVRKEFCLMPWLNWQRRFWYYLAFSLNRVSNAHMGCFSHSTVVRRRVRPRLVLCYNYTETGSLQCAVCVARIKTRTGCFIGRNGPQPRKGNQSSLIPLSPWASYLELPRWHIPLSHSTHRHFHLAVFLPTRVSETAGPDWVIGWVL